MKMIDCEFVVSRVCRSTLAVLAFLGASCSNVERPEQFQPPMEVLTPAREVIAALDNVKERIGYYPTDLDAYEIGFLDRLPQPTWGVGRWEYEGGGDSYTLFVRRKDGHYEGMWYNSKKKSWAYDQ